MEKLHWSTYGNGNINLIFIHGWGMNSQIWNTVLAYFCNYFKCYLIDLPGFGKNKNFPLIKIKDIIKLLHYHMPKNSIWIGWSMGSLIINAIGLLFPNDVKAIINVCSSPCFIKKNQWPGMKIDTLNCFLKQLIKNYQKTTKNFLKLQTLITESSLDKKQLSHNINKILSEPIPKISALKQNFQLIINTDLRRYLNKIKIPIFNIYGTLDILVPIKIRSILDILYHNSYSCIVNKSAHMPFLSHPKKFFNDILQFTKIL